MADKKLSIMHVTIDRFEGNFAVCEKDDRKMINIDQLRLPPEAKEGDVLAINGDAITVDLEETQKRKEEIADLTKDLWQ